MDAALNLFHYLWSFALIISIIVFVHEGGHFLLARACGVRVETFSIGFGRELLGRTDRRGTRWKIALLPLGGYVKMFGDASSASTPDLDAFAAMTEAEKRVSFHHQALWRKILIVAAGPCANFVLTIAVFTYFIYATGINSTAPVVGEIVPGSPASSAGLKPGDRILEVDGRQTQRFSDIPEALLTNLGKPVAVTLQRGEATLHKTLTPVEITEQDALGNAQSRPMIGIKSQHITWVDVGLGSALLEATSRTYGMCVTTVSVMGQIVRGERGTRDLKGPLGIAKLSGEVTQQGGSLSERLRFILWFVALLSVNLGFINLLPIPLLDGGHIAFYLVEALRGRPVAAKFQDYSYRAGFILIIGLMGFSLFNDVRQLL